MAQPLTVQVLKVREYAEDGEDYRTHSYPLPTWEQIESALRSLNHYRLPFMEIGLEDNDSQDGWYRVYGGPNGYAITATTREAGRVKYDDPTLTECQADVWWSGDGYYPAEWHVCYDIELVVQVTRTFAETGLLDSSVIWQPDV